MTHRLRRSMLFVPGSNPRALRKARGLDADGFILDLEDAVAPAAKRAAREAVVAEVKAGGFGAREVVVRVNGADAPWWREDAQAVAAARPDAVLIPKVSTAEDVAAAADALLAAGLPAEVPLWAMIETPRAILELAGLAACAGRPRTPLAAFVLGTNDLAKATRARLAPGRPAMVPWMSMTIAAARAFGLDALDGVFADFSDIDGLRRECEQARDLGMDGKTLIHPGQIAVCNETFAPSGAEIDEARRIVAAFADPANTDRGAIPLDGRMVERLHAEDAERTLALAAAVRARAAKPA